MAKKLFTIIRSKNCSSSKTIWSNDPIEASPAGETVLVFVHRKGSKGLVVVTSHSGRLERIRRPMVMGVSQKSGVCLHERSKVLIPYSVLHLAK
jgi:hypothetical protein